MGWASLAMLACVFGQGRRCWDMQLRNTSQKATGWCCTPALRAKRLLLVVFSCLGSASVLCVVCRIQGWRLVSESEASPFRVSSFSTSQNNNEPRNTSDQPESNSTRIVEFSVDEVHQDHRFGTLRPGAITSFATTTVPRQEIEDHRKSLWDVSINQHRCPAINVLKETRDIHAI